MGRADNAFVRESAELAAHQGERLVVETVGRPLPVGKMRGDCHAHGVRVALRRNPLNGGHAQRRAVEAEVRRPDDFPLRDGDAAGKLGQILPEGGLQDEAVEFGEAVRGFEPPRPADHFPQARNIGRGPGKAVSGELVAFEQGGVGPATGLYARRNAAARFVKMGFGCGERLFEEGDREGHGVGRTPFSSVTPL